jgi:hypothetical protein
LGGALATLFTAHLFSSPSYENSKISLIYTIGSPMVGNREFVNWFNNKCAESDIANFRISQIGDPIQNLPNKL